jgi:hypothetical protein
VKDWSDTVGIRTQDVFPTHDARKPRKRAPVEDRESTVLRECLEWLRSQPDLFVWRNNSGAVQFEGGGYLAFGLKGSADIIGMTGGGRFLAIECKSRTGKQSPDQKAFEVEVLRRGGVYLLVHDFGELREKMIAKNLA